MKFIAIELSHKPFIVWGSIPEGSFEDPESEYFESRLVLDEADVPVTVFGVCPLKIVSGKLVNRTNAELNEFKAQWNTSELLRNEKLRINTINSGSFEYDSESFPMDERSRVFYQAFDRARGIGDVKCMTTDGASYNLSNAKIDAFLDAYFLQLRLLSQPLV